ncbi:MAG TPA: hypothetical protein VI893_05685 [Thermoplasmata archaeon]|nr:hypothetical protein [Thermoplasmata archaeon]
MDGKGRVKPKKEGKAERMKPRYEADGSGGPSGTARGLGIPQLFCDDPPPPVAPVSSPGVKNRLSRCDHTHEGVHRITSADGTVRIDPANGLGDVDLSVQAAGGLPVRVVSRGSVPVASGANPILATFRRQPGERVVPMVWASEKSGVFIIGAQGSLAPANDRTLSVFLEKTSTPDEMNLRCNNGDEDVTVEWAVLGLVA